MRKAARVSLAQRPYKPPEGSAYADGLESPAFRFDFRDCTAASAACNRMVRAHVANSPRSDRLTALSISAFWSRVTGIRMSVSIFSCGSFFGLAMP